MINDYDPTGKASSRNEYSLDNSTSNKSQAEPKGDILPSKKMSPKEHMLQELERVSPQDTTSTNWGQDLLNLNAEIQQQRNVLLNVAHERSAVNSVFNGIGKVSLRSLKGTLGCMSVLAANSGTSLSEAFTSCTKALGSSLNTQEKTKAVSPSDTAVGALIATIPLALRGNLSAHGVEGLRHSETLIENKTSKDDLNIAHSHIKKLDALVKPESTTRINNLVLNWINKNSKLRMLFRSNQDVHTKE